MSVNQTIPQAADYDSPDCDLPNYDLSNYNARIRMRTNLARGCTDHTNSKIREASEVTEASEESVLPRDVLRIRHLASFQSATLLSTSLYYDPLLACLDCFPEAMSMYECVHVCVYLFLNPYLFPFFS